MCSEVKIWERIEEAVNLMEDIRHTVAEFAEKNYQIRTKLYPAFDNAALSNFHDKNDNNDKVSINPCQSLSWTTFQFLISYQALICRSRLPFKITSDCFATL